MARIRTAILGYGRNGSSMHAGAIAGNPDFLLAAACDVEAGRREQARERFGCAVYDDHHRMLDECELDLVCVVTRSDQHAAMVCDCLRGGVDVLVTKPWALDQGEAESMIRARDETGRLLLPWLPARWGCDYLRLRELLREKAVGEVFLIRRIVSAFATRSDWQTERRFGGGYLLNWGAHILEPPVLLAGGRVRSAYGKLRQTINPGDVEDVFLALLTMENGCVVQAEHTIASEPLPSWVIQGTRGTITVREMSLELRRVSPGRPDDPTKYPTMDGKRARVTEETLSGAPYGDENVIYREIARAVRREGDYSVSTAEALDLTRLLDAVRRSHENDRVVML